MTNLSVVTPGYRRLRAVVAGTWQFVVTFYGKKFEKTVRLAPGTSTSIRPTF